ncbi:MAG: flagellar basal body protein [Alphaproteobacteria bacterium]|nr:flagellar basal body protein [Alphaproteobacteria bacterium]
MMTNAITIALSGLNSAAQRVSAAASNIANAFTSGSLEEGEQAPYTPLDTTSKADALGGVQTRVIPRDNPFSAAYEPNSPFANEDGIVGVPNVDLAEEIVKMKLAEISYKANLKSIKVAGELFDELLKATDD